MHDKIGEAALFQNIGNALSVCLMLRMLLATDAHPRIGVLVRTLMVGFDDIMHFFLLVGVLFAASTVVAYTAFGSKEPSFSSVPTTIETLLSVTLGEWPEGALSDLKLFVFLAFFLALNFFLVLNYIIAIIVDAFTKVKAALEEDESEQSIFADIKAIYIVEIKRRLHGWPSTAETIDCLEKLKCTAVSCSVLKAGLPKFRRLVLYRWLQHYHNHSEHLRPAPAVLRTYDHDIADKLAYMLGKRVPTTLEILSQKQRALRARRQSTICRRQSTICLDGATAAAAVIESSSGI
uniref:Ion transport domain-containing protein n=1 Tax=Haptolina ericina TaxID=156174 RepID=A0A7S3C5R7_9EUKA